MKPLSKRESNKQKDLAAYKCYSGELLSAPAVQKMAAFIQHGDTTCLQHVMAVAYFSLRLSRCLHVRCHQREMIRGALLHDFFLYDWHEKRGHHSWHGFTHPAAALRNASLLCPLTKRERDIIVKHMWPLTLKFPRYRESYIVCLADKICSLQETFRSHPYGKLQKELTNRLLPATEKG